MIQFYYTISIYFRIFQIQIIHYHLSLHIKNRFFESFYIGICSCKCSVINFDNFLAYCKTPGTLTGPLQFI